jgi:hypothetical protein
MPLNCALAPYRCQSFVITRCRIEGSVWRIDYCLRRYREDNVKRHTIESDIETQMAALEQSLRAQTTGPIRDGSCGGLIARDAFRTMVDVETLASQKPHERYVELLCNLNGEARRRTYAHYHRDSPHQGLLKQFEARPAR